MTATLDKPVVTGPPLTPPARRRPSVQIVLGLVVVLFLTYVCSGETDISFSMLVEGYHGVVDFISNAFPPDLRWTKTVEPGLTGIFTTFAMAFMGTLLALPVSLLLAVLASRTTTPHPAARAVSRTLLTFLRAIPDVVFALIFVTAVGLGPFSGVLALVFHGTGVQAKLWAEAMDEVDTGPAEALRTTGASSWQVLLHAILPTAAPTMVGLVLYRLDTNVRTALTLGIVGAGGIGFLIDQSIQLFRFQTMMTYILMVLVLILTVEFLSGYIRKRLAA